MSYQDQEGAINISGKMLTFIATLLMSIGSITGVYTTLKTDIVVMKDVSDRNSDDIKKNEQLAKEFMVTLTDINTSVTIIKTKLDIIENNTKENGIEIDRIHNKR